LNQLVLLHTLILCLFLHKEEKIQSTQSGESAPHTPAHW